MGLLAVVTMRSLLGEPWILLIFRDFLVQKLKFALWLVVSVLFIKSKCFRDFPKSYVVWQFMMQLVYSLSGDNNPLPFHVSMW